MFYFSKTFKKLYYSQLRDKGKIFLSQLIKKKKIIYDIILILIHLSVITQNA